MRYILVIIIFTSLIISVHSQIRNGRANSSAGTIKAEILTKIELNSQIIAPVFYDNKIFTIENLGIISCYELSGNILWKHNVGSILTSRPIVSDQVLAVATTNKEILTLKTSTGEQIQSIGIDDSISTDLALVQYSGEKELMIPKATESNSAILFGTASGKLMCYDLETLQEYWRNSDASGMIKSRLHVIANKILFTSKDGFIYKLDSRNGLLIWRWKEKAETDFSDSDISSDDKKIFVVDNENSLFAINLLLGNLAWKSAIKFLPATGLSSDRKKLLAMGVDSKFYFISSEKGTELRSIKRFNGFDNVKVVPIPYKKFIFYADKNSIFSLDEKYNEELLVTVGEGQINSLTQISANKFLASNINGTIIIFSVR